MGGCMLIRIGSRKSDLARIQAYQVGEALQKVDSSIKVEYIFSESLGDKNLTDPLWKSPEQGIFTQDLFKDITSGKTDINVHSWKDLPTETNNLTSIYATMNRENPHDMLLLKKGSIKKIQESKKAIIASSSPRRIYNINNFITSLLPFELNSIDWKDVRGNIQTRLKKVFEQEYDGIIVAKAAIDRLLSANQDEFQQTRKAVKEYIQQCQWMILPLSLNPCAAAQGGLAIEARKDDQEIRSLLKKINNEDHFVTIGKEREIHSRYGGGCHQKLGVSILSLSYGKVLSEKGDLDTHGKIDTLKLLSSSNNFSKKIDPQIFFPNIMDAPLFSREPISNVTIPHNSNILVSRANALQSNFTQQDGQLIWTAGLTTWKKLAQRGYWINGSNEGLGDELFQQINFLPFYTDNFQSWVKLTHNKTPTEFQNLPIIETYSLNRLDTNIEWKKKKVCYWKSGSAFLQALKEYPQIIQAKHICGPGITYKTIQKYVPKELIKLNLNFDTFIKENIR
jgi:hydroxymethylbilane synthase